jgi:hypothetical protein
LGYKRPDMEVRQQIRHFHLVCCLNCQELGYKRPDMEVRQQSQSVHSSYGTDVICRCATARLPAHLPSRHCRGVEIIINS